MPRSLNRNRSDVGTKKKIAPTVGDKDVQAVLNETFEEINELNKAINSSPNFSSSSPSEGKHGDMRLYKGRGLSGEEAYFLQGKFGEAWASVQLSLDMVNSLNTDIKSVYQGGGIPGDEPYITRYGVTYDNLSNTFSVGKLASQVAQGNHKHDHWTDNNPIDLDTSGTDPYLEANILDNEHINLIHFPLQRAGLQLHDDTTMQKIRLEGEYAQSNTRGISGGQDFSARGDHGHALDVGINPIWTGIHLFTGIGDGSNDYSVEINPGSGALGLHVIGDSQFDGDVEIDGDLTVEVATNNTATLTNDVILNQDQDNLIDLTNITTIYGQTTIGGTGAVDTTNAGLIVNASVRSLDMFHVRSQQNEQILIEYDSGTGSANDPGDHWASLGVDTGGNLIVSSRGNMQLYPSDYEENGAMVEGTVLPKGTRIADLGAFNRLWRTGYFAEIYAETLVAQDVLATIGGRIMVAPTTTIEEAVDITDTVIKVKHNNAWPGDYLLFKAAPAGLPTFEVMQVTAGPTWSYTDTLSSFVAAGTGAGYASTEYANMNLKTKVTTSSAHGLEDGVFVIISGTGGHAINQLGYDGAFKIAFKTVDQDDDPLTDACADDEFFISSPFLSGHANNIGTVKGPPFEYTVRRNQDNTLENTWNVGDAAVNIGYKEGDGYIELTATETIHNALGPQIALFSRTGTNLITNTGFDSTSDGWTLYGATRITDTANVYTGSGAIEMVRANVNDNIYMYQSGVASMSVGDEFIVECWVKASIAGPKISLYATSCVIVDTATTAEPENTLITLDGDRWQRCSWMLEATSSATLNITIWHGESNDVAASNISSTIWIDNVSVYENPPWNSDKATIALGNLNNYVDYNDDSTDYFGMAIGNDLTLSTIAGFKGMTFDQSKGLRLFGTDIKMYDPNSTAVLNTALWADGTIKMGTTLGADPLTPAEGESTSFHFIPKYQHTYGGGVGSSIGPALFLNAGVYIGDTPIIDSILTDRGTFSVDGWTHAVSGDMDYVVGDMVARVINTNNQDINSKYRCKLATTNVALDVDLTVPEDDPTHWDQLVADGLAAPAAPIWYAGTNDPTNSGPPPGGGVDGDWFVNTVAETMWYKSSGNWSQQLDVAPTDPDNPTFPTHSNFVWQSELIGASAPPPPTTAQGTTYDNGWVEEVMYVDYNTNELWMCSGTREGTGIQGGPDYHDWAWGQPTILSGKPGPEGDPSTVPGPPGDPAGQNDLLWRYASWGDETMIEAGNTGDEYNGLHVAYGEANWETNLSKRVFNERSLRLSQIYNFPYQGRLYLSDGSLDYAQPIFPDTDYIFSFYLACEETPTGTAAPEAVMLYIKYNDATYAANQITFAGQIYSQGFLRHHYAFTTPSGIDGIRIEFRHMVGSSLTQQLYLDGLMLERAGEGQTTPNTWTRGSNQPFGLAVESFTSPPTGAGLFMGKDGTKFGFYGPNVNNQDPEWRTYMNSEGDFYLKGAYDNSGLMWDHSNSRLTIRGSIELENPDGEGSTLTVANTYKSGINIGAMRYSDASWGDYTTGMFIGCAGLGTQGAGRGNLFKMKGGNATIAFYDRLDEYGTDINSSTEEAGLKMKGSDIKMEDCDIRVYGDGGDTDMNVFIGNFGNVFGQNHDVIVGSWEDQQQSSPEGAGILVKHDIVRRPDVPTGPGSGYYDYTKIHKNGFNRAGYDYPIFIGCVPECNGWQTDNANTSYGIRSNKIFDNARFPVSYESVVPAGRMLVLTWSPVPISWSLGTNATPNIFCGSHQSAVINHSHLLSDTWGEDTETIGQGTAYSVAINGFFCATDTELTNNNKWQSLSAAGDIFRDNTNYSKGPWTSYIKAGVNVVDLRFFNIICFPEGGISTKPTTMNWGGLKQDVNFGCVTIWEMDDQGWDDTIFQGLDLRPLASGVSFGQNPF